MKKLEVIYKALETPKLTDQIKYDKLILSRKGIT